METESTSLSAGHPASRSLPAGSAAGSQTLAEASPSSLSGWLKGRTRDGSSGRTSQPCFPSMEDATSQRSSPNSRGGMSKPPTEDGRIRESSPTHRDASAFRGECWTQDIPEFPHFRGRSRSEGVVSSLSDFVETGPAPQRYCLAASYAEALLRRAARLGYAMPPTLEKVLRRSASPLT